MALFPLMYPTTCDTVLRRHRQQHVHVIGHHVSLKDAALTAFGKGAENRTKIATKLTEQRFPTKLRDEDHVVLALPFCVIQALVLIHPGCPFRVL